MRQTECKDCKLSDGDCGHHFVMDGITHYDIASLNCCDKYGGCEFFKAKENPKGDLISRKALIEAVEDMYEYAELGEVLDVIKDAPTVEPEKVVVANVTFDKDELDQIVRDRVIEPFKNGELVIKDERPHGKWEEDWQEDLDFMSRKGWKCPFCKWRTTYGESNFCMNCGADLRGGKASD